MNIITLKYDFMILYSLMAYRGNAYTEFLTVISEEQDYVLIYTFLPKQKELQNQNGPHWGSFCFLIF